MDLAFVFPLWRNHFKIFSCFKLGSLYYSLNFCICLGSTFLRNFFVCIHKVYVSSFIFFMLSVSNFSIRLKPTSLITWIVYSPLLFFETVLKIGINSYLLILRVSFVAQLVKNLPAMWVTWVQSIWHC